MSNIFTKLDLSSRAAATAYAFTACKLVSVVLLPASSFRSPASNPAVTAGAESSQL